MDKRSLMTKKDHFNKKTAIINHMFKSHLVLLQNILHVVGLLCTKKRTQ